MILNELSKSLPLSLRYLDLNLVINPNDLQIAFENCKQVELKKLLIMDWSHSNIVTTLKVIKDFAKVTKLKFLAYHFKENNFLTKEQLCYKSLENIVELIYEICLLVVNFIALYIRYIYTFFSLIKLFLEIITMISA